MRAKRKDANHNEVADQVEKAGWSIFDTSGLGFGFPDLLVGKPGFCVPIEIKDGSKPPSKRKLTQKEQDFKDNWSGPYIEAISGEDAVMQLETLYSRWGR